MNIETILNRTEYIKLTKFILKKYPKCKICLNKARDTHHLIPLDYNLENEEAIKQIKELHILNNLITVCPKCHKRIHNYSGCFKRGEDDKRSKRTQFKKGFDPRRHIHSKDCYKNNGPHHLP